MKWKVFECEKKQQSYEFQTAYRKIIQEHHKNYFVNILWDQIKKTFVKKKKRKFLIFTTYFFSQIERWTKTKILNIVFFEADF